MSAPAPLDPPEDPAGYRPRPLLGIRFWALMVFALVCVLGGVAIAELGPKLLAHRPPPGTASPPWRASR